MCMLLLQPLCALSSPPLPSQKLIPWESLETKWHRGVPKAVVTLITCLLLLGVL